MTEDRRRCKYAQCRKHLPVTARKNAEFCDSRCRSAHHNEQRLRQGAPGKRLDPASAPQSPASGEIHSLSEARLHEPFDRDRILTALKARGSQGIHSHEIRKLGLSGHPSMRISELQERGYEIEHRREHKGRRPGVRYVLISSPGAAVNEAKAA